MEMDESKGLMKKTLISLPLLFFCAFQCGAQLNYRWSYLQVDSTADVIRDSSATKIIGNYSPALKDVYEVVGYSDKEYTRHKPVSELSSFAADIIRSTAAECSQSNVDIGMINFGGIRTTLPQGEIRVYDILSIFPFNNYITYFDIKGSDLSDFIKDCQRRGRFEAFSGCKMVFEGKTLVSFSVGGKPIDEAKFYRMATVDFLMDGGDDINLTGVALNTVNTGVLVRDAIVDYLRKIKESGEILQLKNDERVVTR